MLMDKNLLDSAREVLGEYLKMVRGQKHISVAEMAAKCGLPAEAINTVEQGGEYGINDLLAIIQALDVYIFFADKEKKNPAEPLDTDDMLRAIGQNDPHK